MKFHCNKERLRKLIECEGEIGELGILAISPELHEQSKQALHAKLSEPVVSVAAEQHPHEAAGIPFPKIPTVGYEEDEDSNS